MASKKKLKKQIKRQTKLISELWEEKLYPTLVPMNPVDGITVSCLAVVSGNIHHLSFRYKLKKDEETGEWVNAEPARVDIDGKDAVWSNLAVFNRYMTNEELQMHVDAFIRSMKAE